MKTNPHCAPTAPVGDVEHYVVSLEAFNAMAGMVDALIRVAQLISGGATANPTAPEVSRTERGAVFRLFGQQLDGHLQAIAHRIKATLS